MTPALPHSLEAEQAVIGGVLLVPTAFWQVADLVREQDFLRRDHQMIWRAIAELQAANEAPDAVSLGDWFEDKGIADLIGGGRYILELANTTPSAANIETYARIVADKATLRRMADAGAQITKLALHADGRPVPDLADEARRLLTDTMPLDARAVVSARDAVRTSIQRIQDRFNAGEVLSGLDTGIDSLNAATGGLQPQKLYILAARPSMGKSLVAGHIASAAGRTGKRVAIFSIEMAADEWTDRFLAAEARIDSELLARPAQMSNVDWSRLTPATVEVCKWPIFIDDSGTQTLMSVQARAMQMHAAGALSLIVLDHLGLMDVDTEKNVAHQIGLVTKGLKAIAKKLRIPFLLLCQLNRGGAGKEPTMTDLRESGRIEEDADAVIMLHRPAYYEGDNSATPRGYTKALIRKLRGGKLRTLHWSVDLPTMRVEDGEEWIPAAKEDAVARGRGRSMKDSYR
jgi:replicative DNA helicase